MQLRIPLAFLMFLGAASCGGGGGGGGGGEPVLEVVKWTPSGDNQTDTVGQTMPLVIRVKVTLDGALASGVTVHFTGGNLGTPSMVTGSNGIATSTWTLNEVAGPQQVTASVDGAVGSPITFHATALPGPASKLVYAGPESLFVADTAHTFAGFAVKVADAFDNGLQGRWVQWSSTGPIQLATDSIITGADGLSTMFGVAGSTPGDITVTATVTGLTGSPRVFTGSVVQSATTVNVSSNFYSPDSLNVPAGSAVQWVWVTGTHSVTSMGPPTFLSSDTEVPAYTWGPILFNTPGVYHYQCAVHGAAMKGVVVVN